MRLISFLLVVFLFSPARLHATGSPPILAVGVLGVVLSRGLVTYPIHKGVWQVKIAPTYVMNKDSRGGQSVDMSGAGFGAALTYGLSDHWGLNFIAGYVKTTGERHFSTCYTQGDVNSCDREFTTPKLSGNSNGNPGEAKGFSLLVNLIWDHWSGDGFRLPVYLGTGFMQAEGKVEMATGLKRDAKVSSPVITLGLGPSFRVKQFRLGGFFLLSGPIGKGKGSFVDFDPATGAVNSSLTFDITNDPMESGAAIMGLEATYLPWGLSVGYSPPVEGQTSIGLKWSREWGG